MTWTSQVSFVSFNESITGYRQFRLHLSLARRTQALALFPVPKSRPTLNLQEINLASAISDAIRQLQAAPADEPKSYSSTCYHPAVEQASPNTTIHDLSLGCPRYLKLVNDATGDVVAGPSMKNAAGVASGHVKRCRLPVS